MIKNALVYWGGGGQLIMGFVEMFNKCFEYENNGVGEKNTLL